MSIYDDEFYTPNYGYPKGTSGRNGHKIIGVGVHVTGASWQSNYSWIKNPESNASYNCVILEDGSKYQLVSETNAAYSHGRINNPSWPLLKSGVNPNLYTLSVARTGSNQRTWTERQMGSTIEVIKHWSRIYGFPADRPHVFGHFEIDSVNRPYCPGREFFDELIKKLREEEDSVYKTVVVVYSESDSPTALRFINSYLNGEACQMYRNRDNRVPELDKYGAETVYVLGGGTKDLPTDKIKEVVDLSGENYFQTAEKAGRKGGFI